MICNPSYNLAIISGFSKESLLEQGILTADCFKGLSISFFSIHQYKHSLSFNSISEVELVLIFPDLTQSGSLQFIDDCSVLFHRSMIFVFAIEYTVKQIFKLMAFPISAILAETSELLYFNPIVDFVHMNRHYVSPVIISDLFTEFQLKHYLFQNLSAREQDIANGILNGLSYKMIASEYQISIDMVRQHIKSLYRKLSVNSKAELIAIFKS